MTLAELLTNWRESRPADSRSEAACGAALFVGQTTFGGWIRGSSLPHNPRIPLLANCLGMPVDELFAIVCADRKARGTAMDTEPIAQLQADPVGEAG